MLESIKCLGDDVVIRLFWIKNQFKPWLHQDWGKISFAKGAAGTKCTFSGILRRVYGASRLIESRFYSIAYPELTLL